MFIAERALLYALSFDFNVDHVYKVGRWGCGAGPGGCCEVCHLGGARAHQPTLESPPTPLQC